MAVTIEPWYSIPKNSFSFIPPNFFHNPIGTISQFGAEISAGENYQSSSRVYIYPPVSGDYTFWTANDNISELSLSPESLVLKRVNVALLPGWTNCSECTKYAAQVSVPNYLIGGQKYYIESLKNDDISEDRLSVGWQMPNGTLQRPIPGFRFAPYKAAEASIIFAVIGDYGLTGTNEAAVAALVKSWQPRFIITTGDNNYYNGTAAKIDGNIGKYFHDYIYPYKGIYGAGAAWNKFFPSLGNHDIITSNGAPYYSYFTLPGNERYYDFVKGDIHFFAVNSNPGEKDGTSSTSVQAMWLKRKLAESVSAWNIVYFHHSPYSSGTAHGSQIGMRWPFKAWGADAVLAGHNHNYERITKDNIPYIVIGLGGYSKTPFKAVKVTGSIKRYYAKYGAVKVKASASSLSFKFFNTDYSLIDSFTVVKAAVPAPALKTKTSSVPVITVSGPKELNNLKRTMLSTSFDSAAVYQWKLNDIIINDENKNFISVTMPGTYKVQVIKTGSIAISESITITRAAEEIPTKKADTVNTASENPAKYEKTYDLKVYPNPNNGVFKIAVNMAIQKESAIKVQVMNNLGQIVYNKEFAPGNRYIVETIELDKALPQGIYNLQIMIGNKTENISMVLLK